jgi:hypothetical protein
MRPGPIGRVPVVAVAVLVLSALIGVGMAVSVGSAALAPGLVAMRPAASPSDAIGPSPSGEMSPTPSASPSAFPSPLPTAAPTPASAFLERRPARPPRVATPAAPRSRAVGTGP